MTRSGSPMALVPWDEKENVGVEGALEDSPTLKDVIVATTTLAQSWLDHPPPPPRHDEEGEGEEEGEAEGEGEENAFCQDDGMSMTMYMDGFHWTLLGRRQQRKSYEQQPPELSMHYHSPATFTQDDGNHHHHHHSNQNSNHQNAQPKVLLQLPAQPLTAQAHGHGPPLPPPPPCLVYLFPSWRLDNRGSFEGAVIFSFLLALLMELLSALRCQMVAANHNDLRLRLPSPSPIPAIESSEDDCDEEEETRALVLSPQQQNRQSPVVVTLPSSTSRNNRSSIPGQVQQRLVGSWSWWCWNKQRISLTLIYGLQALLGYILMFLAMTFSWEILCSLLLGLMAGHAILFSMPSHPSAFQRRRHQQQPPQQQQQQVPPSPRNPTTITTPPRQTTTSFMTTTTTTTSATTTTLRLRHTTAATTTTTSSALVDHRQPQSTQ